MAGDANEPVTRREFERAVATIEIQIATIVQNTVERDELHRQAHEREHAMSELAIQKSEAGVTQRLDMMNAFRDQITSERSHYITRIEAEKSDASIMRMIEDLRHRIEKLNDWMSHIKGREATIGMVPIVVSLIAAMIGMYAILGR